MTGRSLDEDHQVVGNLQREIAALPGAVDVFVRQRQDYPTMDMNVDRILANEAGLTQKDVATSLLISLSTNGQVAPNQWLDLQNGVNYQVAAQTPQYKINTFDAMRRMPITAPSGGVKQLLQNLARLKRNISPEIESHYNTQPVVDIFASPDRRDLGGSRRTSKGLLPERPTLPRGTTIDLRGQATLPTSLKINQLFDQSLFVRAAAWNTYHLWWRKGSQIACRN